MAGPGSPARSRIGGSGLRPLSLARAQNREADRSPGLARRAEDRARTSDTEAPPQGAAALAEQRSRQAIVPLTGLVFTTDRGTALDSRNVTRYLQAHLARLWAPPPSGSTICGMRSQP